MFKALGCIILFFCIASSQSRSQVLPKEGVELNYRIIGFTFPAPEGVNVYKLEIAAGKINTDEEFGRKLFRTEQRGINKVIAEVPEFGKEYTWRVVYISNNTTHSKSPFYHFSTGQFRHPDSPAIRLRIITPAEKYADAYVFLNTTGALYDMNGQPVWYLPHSDQIRYTEMSVRDLKATSDGTLTFIIGGRDAAQRDAYEIDYNCNILWKAPNTGMLSNDTIDHYNHELTKLSNGHYMVLGSEMTWTDPKAPPMGRIPPRPQGQGTVPMPVAPPNPNRRPGMQPLNHRITYGTIMEFDKKGNLQWSWKSSSYFPTSDLVDYPNKLRQPMYDVHQNSFFFDEKNKAIYLSYKNIHRILKLSYPNGTVLKEYGEIYKPGMQHTGIGTYCFQHSIKKSDNGDLYLFNNNSCHRECVPEIVVMREPAGDVNYPEVVWNYEFPVESLETIQERMGLTESHRGKGESTVGGNVVELPDRSMFASLCTPYSDLFIVNREKKVLWNAVSEKWSPKENAWRNLPQYRASIITSRKDLEQLILRSLNAN
jgi:hypothetical protein